MCVCLLNKGEMAQREQTGDAMAEKIRACVVSCSCSRVYQCSCAADCSARQRHGMDGDPSKGPHRGAAAALIDAGALWTRAFCARTRSGTCTDASAAAAVLFVCCVDVPHSESAMGFLLWVVVPSAVSALCSLARAS